MKDKIQVLPISVIRAGEKCQRALCPVSAPRGGYSSPPPISTNVNWSGVLLFVARCENANAPERPRGRRINERCVLIISACPFSKSLKVTMRKVVTFGLSSVYCRLCNITFSLRLFYAPKDPRVSRWCFIYQPNTELKQAGGG